MKLPSRKNHKQLHLSFSQSVRKFTVYTTSIGEFFEDATAKLLGGTKFYTQNDVPYCPDLQIGRKKFIEVKSCGRSGRIIVYKRRIEREIAWCESENVELDYVIWSHNCYTLNSDNEQELLDDLADSVLQVIRVPASVIRKLTLEIPVKRINRFNPEGYTHGWQLPKTKILALCNQTIHRRTLKVDTRRITSFPFLTIL